MSRNQTPTLDIRGTHTEYNLPLPPTVGELRRQEIDRNWDEWMSLKSGRPPKAGQLAPSPPVRADAPTDGDVVWSRAILDVNNGKSRPNSGVFRSLNEWQQAVAKQADRIQLYKGNEEGRSPAATYRALYRAGVELVGGELPAAREAKAVEWAGDVLRRRGLEGESPTDPQSILQEGEGG